jgi:hypothetical protein
VGDLLPPASLQLAHVLAEGIFFGGHYIHPSVR